jgi:hypothetical protein
VPKPSVIAGGALAACALAAGITTELDAIRTALRSVTTATVPASPARPPGGGTPRGGVLAGAARLGAAGGRLGQGLPKRPAAAAAPKVVRHVGAGLRTGSIFNAPLAGTSKAATIASRVGRLIAAAPKGAVISVAMYHFSSLDTAARLIAANRHKVSVHVVLDHESAPYPAAKKLRHVLGGNRTKRSWVVMCAKDRGCIGPEFNHNKFFLFSSTLGSRHIVVQTSANSTDGARDTQWNDALTIQDTGVYDGYLRYFGDLAAQRHNADYHRIVRSGPYRVDFFPWKSGDPVSQALGRVSCAGGTRIRVSVGHFTWGPIARRLWQLDDQGCQVQVVFDIIGRTAIRGLTKPRGRHGGPELGYLTESGTSYAHSKYLLIDGGYDGRPQKVVLTGSNNYTTVGLHGHDEAMITVADAALEAQYVANFDTVFRHSHHLPRANPRSVPDAVLEPEVPDDATGGAE